ncbi:unnamed protein product [Macrosiphum euphorbiae]|uniref:Uncharacterized protein n=1 Tax=Macrosiphum euphorbiae TaxID=13131 RepID=A0AAV0VLQ3_9HEMI|nr:unnamed protein product [Macrosiphum euphorbiae]
MKGNAYFLPRKPDRIAENILLHNRRFYRVAQDFQKFQLIWSQLKKSHIDFLFVGLVVVQSQSHSYISVVKTCRQPAGFRIRRSRLRRFKRLSRKSTLSGSASH